MPLELFATRDFNSQLQRSLGKVYLGAASVGEVMATAAAVTDGDTASWHQAWRGLADDLEARGTSARQAGQTETARRLFLRAAEAFRQASFFHRVDLDCAELQAAWPRAESCFQAAMALTDFQWQGVEIPFEGRFLYGCLAMPGQGSGPWKTLIVPSGYDSCVEEAMVMNGLPALARGFAVLAVDGPGQGKTLYDRNTRAFMRPDYETVMAAVFDFAATRPELDPARIAAIGTSFGGYLVPRAAAHESRIAALVADPGQYDMGAAMLSRLPAALIEKLDEDSAEAEAAFEKLAASPEGALLFRPRMAAHGTATVQAYCRHLRAFSNRDHAPRITCPSLICDNEVDVVSTGQGRELAGAMTGAAVEFVRFAAAEGAGGHCEGMGREIFDERVFPWLYRTLG